MPTNELLAEVQFLRERLKVAEGLLVGFVKGLTPDACVHDHCQICLTHWTSLPFHTKHCLVTITKDFLTPPTPTPGSEGGGRSDKCPFCGAEKTKSGASWDFFKCGTVRHNPDGAWGRGKACLEAELTQLWGLLGRR